MLRGTSALRGTAASLATAVVIGALAVAPAGASTKHGGCVKATVGHHSVCLKAGQRCSVKYQRTYERKGFKCELRDHRRRLVAKQYSF